MTAKGTTSGPRESAVIRAPHDGSEVGVVELAGPAEVRAALDGNVAAAAACRALPAFERAAALRKIADGLEAARAELARTLALEAGKPITQARVELDRSIFVFRDAAEEATRIGGEVLPTDALPTGAGRLAITRRFPLSPIAGITPFNFPVLLAAHKIAPAMACGATITLKPPPQDPLTTLRLAEIIRELVASECTKAAAAAKSEPTSPEVKTRAHRSTRRTVQRNSTPA